MLLPVTQTDDDEAELPVALTWAEYIGRWVRDLGGWTQLAQALLDRAEAVDISDDPQTVERGLRRLATRGHKPGGQYGRWMLRYFGIASPIEGLVKWMGQYHTRFADLPSGFRLEHLMLWNRPPISESRLAAWIQVGLAHVHISRAELTACRDALALAERLAAKAGPAAELEVALLAAQLETDAGDQHSAAQRYATIEQQLATAALPVGDARAYRARLHDQRALHFTRPLAGAPDLLAARALYAAIDDEPYIPFVAFRKAVGLAYCAWKLGDAPLAAQLAQRAVDHAGDGGLVRMRVMALNMLTRLQRGDDANAMNHRARGMAALLEDEDLLSRVAATRPA